MSSEGTEAQLSGAGLGCAQVAGPKSRVGPRDVCPGSGGFLSRLSLSSHPLSAGMEL